MVTDSSSEASEISISPGGPTVIHDIDAQLFEHQVEFENQVGRPVVALGKLLHRRRRDLLQLVVVGGDPQEKAAQSWPGLGAAEDQAGDVVELGSRSREVIHGAENGPWVAGFRIRGRVGCKDLLQTGQAKLFFRSVYRLGDAVGVENDGIAGSYRDGSFSA